MAVVTGMFRCAFAVLGLCSIDPRYLGITARMLLSHTAGFQNLHQHSKLSDAVWGGQSWLRAGVQAGLSY